MVYYLEASICPLKNVCYRVIYQKSKDATFDTEGRILYHATLNVQERYL